MDEPILRSPSFSWAQLEQISFSELRFQSFVFIYLMPCAPGEALSGGKPSLKQIKVNPKGHLRVISLTSYSDIINSDPGPLLIRRPINAVTVIGGSELTLQY